MNGRTEITEHELARDLDDLLRRLGQGESFVLTRNGVPVGELTPTRGRHLVPASQVLSAFTAAVSISYGSLRADLDGVVDQATEPRE